MRKAFSGLLIVCALGLVSHAQPRTSRVLQLEELRFPQIDALDRERTMFILPIGMLEEHGPHLPIASDTFGVMFEANGVATRVSRELPQWSVVMMPPLHYGETGATLPETARAILRARAMGRLAAEQERAAIQALRRFANAAATSWP